MSANDNKVHYDLANVHVALLTIDVSTDAPVITFGTPKKLPGAISMDLSAQGNVIKLRADSMDYYVVNDNLGYSGDLNIAMVPDWFRQEYLNEEMDETAKVLTENSNKNPNPFAMTFEFAGDAAHRRHVLYNVATSRPNIHGENKDNQKEPDTDTLSLTASPLPGGRVKASTTKETPAEVYSAWNTKIWEKAAPSQ